MRLKLVVAIVFLIPILAKGQSNLCAESVGIAPFAVHFNAMDEVSGVMQPPVVDDRKEYADLYYSWNYGDPNSGTWPHSGRSKNHDIGYIACHVYDIPGTYTVTLTVKNLSGDIETYTQEITVQDPDIVFSGENTVCISAVGNFIGAPAGALQVTTTNILDLKDYVATGKRILLRRGDSWTASAKMTFSNISGPVVIGAYGTGINPDERGIYENAPLINVTGTNSGTSFFYYSYNINTWKIMDLHLVGEQTFWGAIGGINGEIYDMLHYRLHIEGFFVPVAFSHWDTDGHDRIALINCHVHDAGQIITYIGSERMALIGNLIYNSSTTHVVRTWQSYKSVIAHNVLHGSSVDNGTGRHALKFHGPSEELIASTELDHLEHRTQYAVIYDNIFGQCGPWQVGIAPTDPSRNEKISDVLVEGNRFLAGYGTPSPLSAKVSVSLLISASYVTVRNNIFDATGGGNSYRTVYIYPYLDLPSIHNRIHNNTTFRNDVNEDYSTYTGVLTESEGWADNNSVQNNLFVTDGVAPLSSIILDDRNGGSYEDHNLLVTDGSYFVDPTNENLLYRNFNLVENSAPVDAGTPVSIFHDYALTERLIGAGIDIGAYEYTSTPTSPTPPPPTPQEVNTYSNPFDYSTTIEYSINCSAHVKLTITNEAGEIISTLVDEDQAKGTYHVIFNGSDYSTGVFYRNLIVDGEEIETKVLIL